MIIINKEKEFHQQKNYFHFFLRRKEKKKEKKDPITANKHFHYLNEVELVIALFVGCGCLNWCVSYAQIVWATIILGPNQGLGF